MILSPNVKIQLYSSARSTTFSGGGISWYILVQSESDPLRKGSGLLHSRAEVKNGNRLLPKYSSASVIMSICCVETIKICGIIEPQKIFWLCFGGRYTEGRNSLFFYYCLIFSINPTPLLHASCILVRKKLEKRLCLTGTRGHLVKTTKITRKKARKKPKHSSFWAFRLKSHRSDWIRTSGLLVPNLNLPWLRGIVLNFVVFNAQIL